jgi:CheY-like chemotaxis protein
MTVEMTGEKKKVLIVEDDPEVVEALSCLLRNAGFQVAQASHALAAVCSLVRSQPDIILVDIRMPVMDGLSLVKEIKSHNDTKHIPIVVVSGLDSAENREAALKAGCVGFVAKPIDARRFPELVAAFINEPRTISLTA